MKLSNINKSYGDKKIFDDFSVSFEKNKITAILGESGSGKTTLLKMVAGLTDFKGETSEIEKPVSMVFQENRLIKNLTVEENLRLIIPDADVKTILKSVGLDGVEKLFPKQLSGGMARRIAIARAIYFPSKTLLLDEPFNSLDVAVKYYITEKIKEIQKNTPRTVLVVTHDVSEAVGLADRIILLSDGVIKEDMGLITEGAEKRLTEALFLAGKEKAGF